MKKNVVSQALVICLMLAGVAVANGQGLYVESKVTGGQDGDEIITTYMMPKKMKAVSSGGEDIEVIRLDREVMYSINTKEKTYSEVTFAEMEKMMKEAGAEMNEKMA